LYEAIHRASTVLYNGVGHRKDAAIINGAHAILYSDNAEATRATLAKVLGTRSVDAGGGWLIFALRPAEIAVHPAEEGGRTQLYLLCDDVAAAVTALQAEGVDIARPISDQGWGLLTAIALPVGSSSASTSPATSPIPGCRATLAASAPMGSRCTGWPSPPGSPSRPTASWCSPRRHGDEAIGG
jgi:hypothetical protein